MQSNPLAAEVLPPAALRAGLFGSALLTSTAVALGAFGAHLLEAQLEAAGQSDTWDTAVHYQLAHGLALLAWTAGASADRWPIAPRATRWVGRGLFAGAILFSGSLYGLALGGPRWLGPITPLGGSLWIVTWLSVLWQARPRR